jgi:hypothetical protein
VSDIGRRVERRDYGSALDFWRDPFDGDGVLLHEWPDKRTWIKCDEKTGLPLESCDLYLVDPLIENNKQRFNDSVGKKYGDGQIIASIPNDIYWNTIVPMEKNGDDKAITRWLNDSDNRAFRTFKGRE